jgi:Xaa-Pro aminopeptidase
VATSPENVAYLTGFRRAARAVVSAPVFGIFSRRGAALVVPAVDAPAAVVDGADVDHVVSYGGIPAAFPPSAGPDARRVEAVLTRGAAEPAGALAEALGRLGIVQSLVGLDGGGLDPGLWQEIVERLADTRIVAGAPFLAEARRVKAPYEIECLGRALHLAEEALDAVIQALERGMTEREAAALYTAEVVKRDAVPRHALVATGGRTWIPAARPTDRALRAGDLVRLDAGCAYRGYCASVARVAVLGEPGPAAEAAYLAIRAGLEAGAAVAAPGATAARLYEAAVRAVAAGGLADHGPDDVGHGIGLALSELPVLASGHGATLAAGEVLGIEAAHYEMGSFGLSVRNTLLITSAGARVLNRSRHDLIVLD